MLKGRQTNIRRTTSQLTDANLVTKHGYVNQGDIQQQRRHHNEQAKKNLPEYFPGV